MLLSRNLTKKVLELNFSTKPTKVPGDYAEVIPVVTSKTSEV